MRETTSESAKSISALRSAESLFHPGSVSDQVLQQISLLTQGMTESMIFASGAIPDPADDEAQEEPRHEYWQRKRKQPNPGELHSEARSRMLQDAARLSFATASLVGALSRFNSQPGQRFTTRHTIVPDPTGKRKAKRITTITHTLFAPRDPFAAGDVDVARAADQTADCE